jgi:WD40 repeat protein
MLLKYVPFLTLKTGIVSSLDFSVCGRFLAVVDLAGEISLWDTSTGVCYHPTLSSGCRGRSASLWVNERRFVCGLTDGSIGTCQILEGTFTAAKCFVSKSIYLFITNLYTIFISRLNSTRNKLPSQKSLTCLIFLLLIGWQWVVAKQPALCSQVSIVVHSK